MSAANLLWQDSDRCAAIFERVRMVNDQFAAGKGVGPDQKLINRRAARLTGRCRRVAEMALHPMLRTDAEFGRQLDRQLVELDQDVADLSAALSGGEAAES